MVAYLAIYDGQSIGQVKGQDYQEALQNAKNLAKQLKGETADMNKVRISNEVRKDYW